MECVDSHGHCPMRFLNYRTRGGAGGVYAIETLDEFMDICICHRDYNHCVANNLDGEIPEIMPGDDLDLLNITHLTQVPEEGKGEENPKKLNLKGHSKTRRGIPGGGDGIEGA